LLYEQCHGAHDGAPVNLALMWESDARPSVELEAAVLHALGRDWETAFVAERAAGLHDADWSVWRRCA
jgi:hypothetical protein